MPEFKVHSDFDLTGDQPRRWIILWTAFWPGIGTRP